MKKSEKQKQEKARQAAEKLQLAIEQSRCKWLGKKVLFLGFLNQDNEYRQGVFTAVRDNGEVVFAGPIYPWSHPDEITIIQAGGEEELLSVLTGTVVGDVS